MTILKNNWTPELSFGDIPKYQTIANAIRNDIGNGILKVGERMPTHRNLAWDLKVTVGTVSRAYAEAERLGLIGGEVGRGTYVRDLSRTQLAQGNRAIMPDILMPEEAVETGAINLSFNFPPPAGAVHAMRNTLAELSQDVNLSTFMDYQPHAGMDRHKEAASLWLKKRHLNISPGNVMITPGAHNAALCALIAITNPGDTILVERLTFPGSKAIARMLNLRLVAVDIDAEGLCPDNLRKICLQERPKALYCVPTLQNPTNAVMSAGRIQAIAKVADEFGLYVIEDDLFALLLEKPPTPLCSLLPDLGFYVTSVSKTLSPGSRTGYITGPIAKRNEVIAAIRATCWMAPPLSTEITSRWIFSGIADEILKQTRQEARVRRDLFLKIFKDEKAIIPEGALHAWLQLPQEWDSQSFASALLPKEVILSPSHAFAMPGDTAPNSIRICLGAPKQTERLKQALEIIAETLRSGPAIDSMTLV